MIVYFGIFDYLAVVMYTHNIIHVLYCMLFKIINIYMYRRCQK